MSNVLSIAWRELRSYFDSPIAYVVIDVFLVMSSWLFLQRFFVMGQADMRPFFSFLPWLFLFFAPAITMRLWAEERKLGTIEVLLTLPVRTVEAVLGKFLAALGLVATTLLLSAILPLSIQRLSPLDMGPVIGGYLGALALASAFLAAGLFVSGLTENQIVAFILSVTLSFLLLMVGTSLVVSSLPKSLGKLAEYIGLQNHFESIARGVLDSRDLVYYLSITALFLALNAYVIEHRRR